MSGKMEWIDSVDPADRTGDARAYFLAEGESESATGSMIKLVPAEEMMVRYVVAQGISPGHAAGIVQGYCGETGILELESELPADAQLEIRGQDKDGLRAYPDADGKLRMLMAPGPTPPPHPLSVGRLRRASGESDPRSWVCYGEESTQLFLMLEGRRVRVLER